MGKVIKYEKAEGGYLLLEDYTYYSKRYNRSVKLKKGMWSDGATGVRDLGAPDQSLLSRIWTRILHVLFKVRINPVITAAWFVHDQLCNTGKWSDGIKVDNWTASTVLGDILWADGYRFESIPWWFGTYFFGGGEARKNGMRRVGLI